MKGRVRRVAGWRLSVIGTENRDRASSSFIQHSGRLVPSNGCSFRAERDAPRGAGPPLGCGVVCSGIVLVDVEDTVHHRFPEMNGAELVVNRTTDVAVDRRVVDLRGGGRDEDAGAERCRVAGDRAVPDGQVAVRPDEDAAAAARCRVAGDRALGDDDGAFEREDAAADWPAELPEIDAVVERKGGAFGVDAAAVEVRRVAGDRAVPDSQCGVFGVDAAAVPARRVAGDRCCGRASGWLDLRRCRRRRRSPSCRRSCCL